MKLIMAISCVLASTAFAADASVPSADLSGEARKELIALVGPALFSAAGLDKLTEPELAKVAEIVKAAARQAAGGSILSDSANSYMRTLGFEPIEVLGETTIKSRTYLVYSVDGRKKAVEADRLISRFRAGTYWAKLFVYDLQQMMDRSGSIQYFYGKAIDVGR